MSWLFPTNRAKTFQDSLKESSLYCRIPDLVIVANLENLSENLVVNLDSLFLLLIPLLRICVFVRLTRKYLEQQILAALILKELLEEQRNF